MCKWLKLAALLLGGIVFVTCASNVTTTVAVGFTHSEEYYERE